MVNDLRRRVRQLEERARRNSSPALTAEEIDQATARYDAAGAGHGHDTYAPPSAFRTMLSRMKPDMARLFLHAQPADLML